MTMLFVVCVCKSCNRKKEFPSQEPVKILCDQLINRNPLARIVLGNPMGPSHEDGSWFDSIFVEASSETRFSLLLNLNQQSKCLIPQTHLFLKIGQLLNFLFDECLLVSLTGLFVNLSILLVIKMFDPIDPFFSKLVTSKLFV